MSGCGRDFPLQKQEKKKIHVTSPIERECVKESGFG